MSNLVAIAYPDEATAGEVAQTLLELQKEHSIELEDLVVAIRKDDGKIECSFCSSRSVCATSPAVASSG